MTTPTLVGPAVTLTQTQIPQPQLPGGYAMAGIPVSMAPFLPGAQAFLPAFHSLMATGQHIGIPMAAMASNGDKVKETCLTLAHIRYYDGTIRVLYDVHYG